MDRRQPFVEERDCDERADKGGRREVSGLSGGSERANGEEVQHDAHPVAERSRDQRSADVRSGGEPLTDDEPERHVEGARRERLRTYDRDGIRMDRRWLRLLSSAHAAHAPATHATPTGSSRTGPGAQVSAAAPTITTAAPSASRRERRSRSITTATQ